MYVCMYVCMYVTFSNPGSGGVAANNAAWAMYQNNAMAGVAAGLVNPGVVVGRVVYTQCICMYVCM
jgi:hypothetical protein